MKAYVCSVGETTTSICCEQLKRYGFEVVLLDEKESWVDKYKRFLELANGTECLRVDADIIVNKHIQEAVHIAKIQSILMAQFKIFDFYQNDVAYGQPVVYRKGAIPIILKNFNKLNPNRPEATAWRLEEINKRTLNIDTVAGMHGFFQSDETVANAKKNKAARSQMERYDFTLVDKLRAL